MLSISCRPESVSSRSPTPGAIAPRTVPRAATPTVQPSSAGRCTRQVSATTSASRGEPCAGPGRAGNRPEPRSRRARSSCAATASPAARATYRQQHPPARLVPGAEPGVPAERRQPAQPLGTDVADRPHQVERADRRARDAEAGPAGRGELAGHRSDPHRDQTGADPRRAEAERAGQGQTTRDVGQGGEQRRHRRSAPRPRRTRPPAGRRGRSPCRQAARRGRTPPRPRVCRRTTTTNIRARITAYSTVTLVIASSPRLLTSRIGP